MGLIPFWAKDAKIASNLLNARADAVATKPAFRAALKRKRCLIPADGFYEWKPIPGQKVKQPYLIGVKDVPAFAFAGLWGHWASPDGKRVDSCTIITTDANELMQQVHNRMPVILDPGDYGRWLDPAQQDPKAVTDLLKSSQRRRCR